jgi:hypothetical protein
MRRFVVLFLAVLFLLTWLIWPKNGARESEPITNLSEQTPWLQKKSQATLSKSRKEEPAIAKPSEQDSDTLANDCLTQLLETAAPSIEDFRKKLVQDINAPVGLWMYETSAPIKPARTPSAADFFLRGLASANMMAGRDNKDPNLTAALELLFKAQEKEPNNAAVLVYAAYLKKQLGDEAGSLELLDQVNVEKMKFDTYEMDALFHIYKHIKSTKDLLHFYLVREKIPIVAPEQIKQFLVENQRQDVGYLMVQNEMNPESKHRASPDGDILFFSAGRALIRQISSVEADKYPPTRDLMAKMKDHIEYKLLEESNLELGCEIEKLQPLVDYFQEVAQ